MEFLYWLESIRTPWLDELMSVITLLGSEMAFLVAALVICWCMDKSRGYYMLTVGFLGTILNQALKLFFRVERPWVRDPEFTIVESARADAGGYSFPSGHTQSAVTVFGTIARWSKGWMKKAAALLLLLLVAFSRMYLGVHTPQDVVVSLLIGAALVLGLYPFFKTRENTEKWMPRMLYGMLAVAAAYVVYVECYPFPADIDPVNYHEGLKNGYSLLGAIAAMTAAHAVESRKIRFDPRAVWWAQILKVVLGMALLLVIKEGLKQPLLALCGGHMAAHAIRYGVMVLAAVIVWPLSFPFFQKLGKSSSKAAETAKEDF